ncbi:hypothetical protein HAX54_020681 [Datura stramonium]|uniref:Uncharacterized protein n=1 Tax=Datura stramonium TaxID=4076 RepID=A0ABS8URI8_DATST|nr:hypothetical protein [Datura stramonium]
MVIGLETSVVNSSNASQKNASTHFSPHFKKQHRNQSKKRPTLSLSAPFQGVITALVPTSIHLSSMNSSNYELQVDDYETIAEIGDGHFVCSSGLDLLCFYQTGYVGKIWICNPITKKALALPILSDFAGRAI